VDQFAQQLTTPNSDVRNLVARNITDKLGVLDGHNPKLPVGPVAADQKERIADSVEQLLTSRRPELVAAIQTGAQTKLSQLKAQLASQVAKSVTKPLNRSYSFYDSWTDPLIGLRGRFNLNQAFYLTAESDVGGFGIGSDIAVQAYAALGCQITRNIHAEVGYRYLYDDFRDASANGFLYQVSLHGAQITAGINF
jgi:small-conductance mechanosensitive channel